MTAPEKQRLAGLVAKWQAEANNYRDLVRKLPPSNLALEQQAHAVALLSAAAELQETLNELNA